MDTKRTNATDTSFYVPGEDAQSDQGHIDLEHSFSPCSSSYGRFQMYSLSSAEESQREIDRKLDSVENYLDRFYTKAKADLRDIKKTLRKEFLSPTYRSSPD